MYRFQNIAHLLALNRTAYNGILRPHLLDPPHSTHFADLLHIPASRANAHPTTFVV